MALIPTEFSVDDSQVVLPENRPFICRPESRVGDTAALLIHGFTATPREMAPLAEHLAVKGIPSIAVRLPGHGTSPDDLAERTFEEWVETVKQGQQFLKKKNKQVVAVGLSTGALVALAAHQSHPFEGLVLLSPYLRTRYLLAPLAGILRHFICYQNKDVIPAEQPYYYSKRPLNGIHQINRLIQRVKKELPSVTVPTFVACADGDQTIIPESAVEIYNLIGSQKKELHRFGAEVPHVLTSAANPRQTEVFVLVSHFIETMNK